MLYVGKNTTPVRRDLHQNLVNSGPDRFVALLQLSVSTRGVIGQFCGPYFTKANNKQETAPHNENAVEI